MGVASGFGRTTFVGPGADIGRATIVIDGDSSPFLAKLAGLKGDALLGLSGIGKEAIKIAKGVTVAATIATVGAVGAVISTFASFEDAFAGVAKTVDATDAELAKIQQGLLDLSKQIPVNFEQLSDLARLAGQFGVATGDIVEFTRVMALLSVTIDDLDIKAAASALARLATILQVPNEQFMNLGSTLTDLGNKFASAEGDILNLSTRIAGASKLIGISAAQVLGIGNAFAVVVGPQGLEAAGTAIQKVLLKMNTAIIENGETLELFAKTAGVSVEEFKRLFEQDAAEAFTRFVEGLGRQGKEAEITLRALELGDARLIRSFLQMAGAGDLLRRSIGEANTAFSENIALTKEAEARFKTLVSQLEVFKNKIKAIGFELGTILKPALVESLKRLSEGLQGLQDVLGPGFTLLAGVLPEITTGMVDLFKGVANLVTAFLRLFSAVSEDGIPAIGQLGLGLGKLLNQLSVQLAPAFTTLGTVLSKLVDLASTIFGGLSDEINTAFGAIGSGISDVLGDVLDAFTESLPQIAPLVVEMSRAFADFLSTSGPEFASFLVSIVERSAKAATGLLDIFSVLGGPVLKILGELFNQIGIVVLELSRIIQRDAGQAFTNLADAIVRLLQAAGPALLGFLTKAIDAFVKSEPAITKFIDTLAALVPVIANALTPVLDVLPGLLGTLAEVLAKVAPGFGKFATKLLQAFSTIAGPLAKVLKIVGDALIEILPLVNLFADAFFKAIGAIAPDVFKTLAGVLKTLIPALTSILPALQKFIEVLTKNLGPIADILIPALAEAIVVLLEIGTRLIPFVTLLLEHLQPILPLLLELTLAFIILAQIFGPLIPAITAVATTIAALVSIGGPLIPILVGMAGFFLILFTQAEKLVPVILDIAKAIGGFLIKSFEIFRPLLDVIGTGMQRFGNMLLIILQGHVLPTFLRIFETLEPVLSAVFTELFAALEEILPLWAPFIDDLGEIAITLLPLFVEVIRELMVPALKLFTRILVPIIDWLMPGFIQALEITVRVISILIRLVGGGMVQAFSTFLTVLIDILGAIYTVVNALNKIPIVGRSIPDSLVSGLKSAIEDLDEFRTSVNEISSSIDMFEGIGSDSRESVIGRTKRETDTQTSELGTMFENLFKDLGEGFGEIESSVVGGTRTAIKGGVTAAEEGAPEIGTSIVDGATTGFTGRARDIPGVVTTTFDSMDEASARAAEIYGEKTGHHVVDGVTGGINAEWTARVTHVVGGQLAGTATYAAETSLVIFKIVGEKIVEGVVNGLTGGSEALARAGKQIVAGFLRGVIDIIRHAIPGVGPIIADALERSFRDAFEIRSPSKKMENIGQQIGQGLLDGIRAQIQAVQDLARQLLEALTISPPTEGIFSPGFKLTDIFSTLTFSAIRQLMAEAKEALRLGIDPTGMDFETLKQLSTEAQEASRLGIQPAGMDLATLRQLMAKTEEDTRLGVAGPASKVVNVGPITVNQVKEDPVATAFKLSNLIAEGVL